MCLSPFDEISFFILEQSLFGREELIVRSTCHGLVNFELSFVVMTDKERVYFCLGLPIIGELLDYSLLLLGGFVSDLGLFDNEPAFYLLIGSPGFSPVDNEAGGVLNMEGLTFMREKRFW